MVQPSKPAAEHDSNDSDRTAIERRTADLGWHLRSAPNPNACRCNVGFQHSPSAAYAGGAMSGRKDDTKSQPVMPDATTRQRPRTPADTQEGKGARRTYLAALGPPAERSVHGAVIAQKYRAPPSVVGLRRTAAGSMRRALLSASAAANAEDSLAREISFPARSRSSCQRTAAAVANPCPAYRTRRRARREEQQNQNHGARIIYFLLRSLKLRTQNWAARLAF